MYDCYRRVCFLLWDLSLDLLMGSSSCDRAHDIVVVAAVLFETSALTWAQPAGMIETQGRLELANCALLGISATQRYISRVRGIVSIYYCN